MTNLDLNLTGLRTNYKTKPLAQLWRILTWTTLIEIGSSRWWHLLLLFQIWEGYKGEAFDIYLFAPHWQIHYPAAPIVPAAVILQWHENQASLALHWRLSSGSPGFLQTFRSILGLQSHPAWVAEQLLCQSLQCEHLSLLDYTDKIVSASQWRKI